MIGTPLLAAAIGLCVTFPQILPAQKPARKKAADDTIEALAEVQTALHAAEVAQIKLLRAGKRSGQALDSVNRAVKNLTAAREIPYRR
jgi:cell division protein FtsB